MASIISSAITAVMYSGSLTDNKVSKFFYASIGSAAIAIILALTVPSAGAAGYTGDAYPWAKSTIIFVALIVLLGVLCKFTPKGLLFAIPVAAVQISVFALLKNGAMNGLTHPCSWWFWWPIAWNFILLVLAWIMLPNGRSVAGAAFFAQLGVSFYVYMPIVSDLRNPPMNWGYPRTWEGFKHAIMRGQYEAIGIQNFGSVREFFAFTAAQMRHYFGDVALQFTSIIASFAIVPLAFGHWIVKKSRRKDFWQWMIAAWVCFFMMSFLLILLANVKGDIQDGFIQKVKFISSHAMIAMWIGYGLVFVSVLLKKWIPAAVLAAVIVLGCFVTPIAQNYCNDRLVFEMGGAEQNGHTFGWQFGAYQLEGAKAINDQLTADEEPLPDPGYPPPMTTNALFFGGTDPGRFVPTYMIHGAKYRSDIKLITQNALADDTYMSVERDTYGDEVWIPAKEDSAEAFNIYVDEVQRGVRQANGDLRIENGRVQVTGALGVMEINGILTKMMFDHDKKFRDFYIEESYVIPWMYPYLSPHGLIMKLNAEFVPYDAATASKDRDFWDWYTRRLLDDPMYRRDFAGQKSFSKLRTAIAGLYARQGRMRDAANAYREAVLLYPVSPEATFRYAQESLLPFSKFDIVLELMDYIDSVDPKNKRTSSMRSHIKMIEEVENTLTALEPKYMRGEISDTERLRLSTVYYRIGKTKQSAQVILPIAFKFTAPQDLKYVATVLMAGEFNAEASRVWKLYLKKVPRDVEAWAASAKTHARLKLIREAQQDFISGYKADQASMIRIVQKDQELFQIAEPLFQPRR
jgi:tetratricopeptide (TPR) repeat protein